jgi:hypothetical protein
MVKTPPHHFIKRQKGKEGVDATVLGCKNHIHI